MTSSAEFKTSQVTQTPTNATPVVSPEQSVVTAEAAGTVDPTDITLSVESSHSDVSAGYLPAYGHFEGSWNRTDSAV